MAGATIPALGPRNRMRCQYRQLEPLWRDLTAFAPEVKFGTRSPYRTDITDRIRQRLTEINDVLIGPLQPYLDPAVHAAALASAEQKAGHGAAPDTAATAQAVTIATALISTEPVNPNRPVVFTTPGTQDYRDEAAWYASVAAAYSHLTTTAKTEEPRRHAVDPAR
ncbi:DUF6545 domain-containing protein [Amycolatopsis panacis]|uniref:DUF6545 domain-containing protein n=1 Tax=Amycolatopsis panacis TaxID=2340917 RepID=A0A419HSQ0_9PSEU|nr:DUF6545 domain-containing protein [Amycolatopsis panacis]RJQ79633.1 hypothetical protein D5S19_26360 [Amycolatopsis panacis]